MTKNVSVLFVCLGNICRSPLAQGIFEYQLTKRGILDSFTVDSCGTGAWHVGNKPHEGSIAIAKEYGFSIENQRARQLSKSDPKTFDWIIAMDSDNLEQIKKICAQEKARVHLMREFDPIKQELNVPDPYYTGNFKAVYEILERSCDRLLEHILSVSN